MTFYILAVLTVCVVLLTILIFWPRPRSKELEVAGNMLCIAIIVLVSAGALSIAGIF
jgi:hypothetical protein